MITADNCNDYRTSLSIIDVSNGFINDCTDKKSCLTTIKCSAFIAFKVWRNWPTLLVKHHCFQLESGVMFMSIANDSETNNSVYQAMEASLAKALGQQYEDKGRDFEGKDNNL